MVEGGRVGEERDRRRREGQCEGSKISVFAVTSHTMPHISHLSYMSKGL